MRASKAGAGIEPDILRGKRLLRWRGAGSSGTAVRGKVRDDIPYPKAGSGTVSMEDNIKPEGQYAPANQDEKNPNGIIDAPRHY